MTAKPQPVSVQRVEKEQGSSPVLSMRASKETLVNLDQKRWMTEQQAPVRPRQYEIGRSKRIW